MCEMAPLPDVPSGIVDNSEMLEAAQASSRGELAKPIHAAACCAVRPGERGRSLSMHVEKSTGHVGRWRKWGANHVHSRGRRENRLSLGTACFPELGLSGLAWQEGAAESALALLHVL